jgi:hypothetical protein
MTRPEARHRVDLQLNLTWQDRQGGIHRASARCLDLSASGARITSIDALEPRSVVILHSEKFGRIGHATVRYCRRAAMKYEIGLHFSTAPALNEILRKEIADVASAG